MVFAAGRDFDPHDTGEFDDRDDNDYPVDREELDDITRDRCRFPDRCIESDPFHSSDECWTAEDQIAYEELLDEERSNGR